MQPCPQTKPAPADQVGGLQHSHCPCSPRPLQVSSRQAPAASRMLQPGQLGPTSLPSLPWPAGNPHKWASLRWHNQQPPEQQICSAPPMMSMPATRLGSCRVSSSRLQRQCPGQTRGAVCCQPAQAPCRGLSAAGTPSAQPQSIAGTGAWLCMRSSTSGEPCASASCLKDQPLHVGIWHQLAHHAVTPASRQIRAM